MSDTMSVSFVGDDVQSNRRCAIYQHLLFRCSTLKTRLRTGAVSEKTFKTHCGEQLAASFLSECRATTEVRNEIGTLTVHL